MGIFEAIYNCRAMRRLKPDPVPEELILKLIDAANRAPTGSNTQAMRWIVVRDPAQRAKLAELNKVAVEAYVGPSSGRTISRPHMSDDQEERLLRSVMWQADHMAEIPVLVIACMQFGEPVGASGAGRGSGSVWPGVQNLLRAARALELGAAPTTLGLTDRAAVRKVLALPDDVEAYALVPVGFPMGRFGPVRRLPVSDTVSWDRWGN